MTARTIPSSRMRCASCMIRLMGMLTTSVHVSALSSLIGTNAWKLSACVKPSVAIRWNVTPREMPDVNACVPGTSLATLPTSFASLWPTIVRLVLTRVAYPVPYGRMWATTPWSVESRKSNPATPTNRPSTINGSATEAIKIGVPSIEYV